MQDHPGAPGTARQESTRTIVSTNDGGNATMPRAPGHERPRTAPSGAARHGRLSAASTAPGADVPPATMAGAPGQYCLSAALRAPGHGRPLAITAGGPGHDRLSAVPPATDHARSAVRHTRAPGQGRPRAASSDVVRPDRPCATPRAPGADVPLATAAGAPGQHRLRAAQRAPDHARSRPAPKAPGQGRPLAASSDVVRPDRPRATLTAPGADVPPATAAGAPGQHRLRAVANATVASPAGQHRLRQEDLPRTPATPNTLTYPHTHQDTIHTHTMDRRVTKHAQSRESANPRLPVATGGPQGGQIMSPVSSLRRRPQSTPRTAAGHRANSLSLQGKDRGLGPTRLPLLPLSKRWRGGRGVRSKYHQVHPAIQVPPHPRSCSTAATGRRRQPPSRAPPPRHCGASRNPAAQMNSVGSAPVSPSLPRTWESPLSPREWAGVRAARIGPPSTPSPNVGEGAGGEA